MEKKKKALGSGIGLVFGAGVGAAFGVILSQLVWGICIGTGVGLIIGSVYDTQKK